MIIKTSLLDKAAFFTTFGGKIVNIEGKYPENVFHIEVNRFLAAYELIGGWVPYNKLCNERRAIKRKTRELAGLPAYFTGNRDSGFKLLDIATYKPFSKKELERFDKRIVG